MPRPRSPNKEASRRRTEVWRAGRDRQRRPESSTVDRALAASVAAFFNARLDTDGLPADVEMIVLGAERILVEKGFDRFEVRGELERRLTRRRDFAYLERISGGAEPAAHQFGLAHRAFATPSPSVRRLQGH
ncbi:hypothetical protein [Rhizobium sp. P007]|uniref:hypothetical protein n=1 Tax=Rhizobium sp. P007 TaxID=285908 RepID=UPI00115AFA0D|nr:hypothetical protein [Rhizobium sp. P007]